MSLNAGVGSPQLMSLVTSIFPRPLGMGSGGRSPRYGSGRAPAFLRQTLKRCLLRADSYLGRAGSKIRVSSYDPCLYFVFRDSGGAVGALPADTDDILACGEPGTFLRARACLGRRPSGACGSRESRWRASLWKRTRRTIPRFSLPRTTPRKRLKPCRPHRLRGRHVSAPSR